MDYRGEDEKPFVFEEAKQDYITSMRKRTIRFAAEGVEFAKENEKNKLKFWRGDLLSDRGKKLEYSVLLCDSDGKGPIAEPLTKGWRKSASQNEKLFFEFS